MGIWYLDSSALVKLVAVEAHSAAMYRWQEEAEARLVTCDLGEAEVLRAVRRVDTALLDRARAVLSTIDIVPLDEFVDASEALRLAGLLVDHVGEHDARTDRVDRDAVLTDLSCGGFHEAVDRMFVGDITSDSWFTVLSFYR